MQEVPLRGGRVTAGVTRVGETVRRPAGPSSAYVRALLLLLERRGFDGVPRFLGVDGRGRDILSFLPGDVPSELDSSFAAGVLAEAARLIRCYHDATAASDLAGPCEVVCHNDLSPCNAVFRDGVPVALIDLDAVAPGTR